MSIAGRNRAGVGTKVEYRKLSVRPILPPQVQRLIGKLQKNYPFFSDMDEIEISKFFRLCRQESYEPGDIIFSEGYEAKDFFLIVFGEVKISIGDDEVAALKAGEIFGEMAILENIPRTATASAGGIVIVLSIPVEILSAKMPILANKTLLSVAQQLSARLRKANGRAKIFVK